MAGIPRVGTMEYEDLVRRGANAATKIQQPDSGGRARWIGVWPKLKQDFDLMHSGLGIAVGHVFAPDSDYTKHMEDIYDEASFRHGGRVEAAPGIQKRLLDHRRAELAKRIEERDKILAGVDAGIKADIDRRFTAYQELGGRANRDAFEKELTRRGVLTDDAREVMREQALAAWRVVPGSERDATGPAADVVVRKPAAEGGPLAPDASEPSIPDTAEGITTASQDPDYDFQTRWLADRGIVGTEERPLDFEGGVDLAGQLGGLTATNAPPDAMDVLRGLQLQEEEAARLADGPSGLVPEPLGENIRGTVADASRAQAGIQRGLTAAQRRLQELGVAPTRPEEFQRRNLTRDSRQAAIDQRAREALMPAFAERRADPLTGDYYTVSGRGALAPTLSKSEQQAYEDFQASPYGSQLNERGVPTAITSARDASRAVGAGAIGGPEGVSAYREDQMARRDAGIQLERDARMVMDPEQQLAARKFDHELKTYYDSEAREKAILDIKKLELGEKLTGAKVGAIRSAMQSLGTFISSIGEEFYPEGNPRHAALQNEYDLLRHALMQYGGIITDIQPEA